MFQCELRGVRIPPCSSYSAQKELANAKRTGPNVAAPLLNLEERRDEEHARNETVMARVRENVHLAEPVRAGGQHDSEDVSHGG